MAIDFSSPYSFIPQTPSTGTLGLTPQVTPQPPQTPQQQQAPMSDKNQKLGLMLYALGGALRGDKDFVQNTLALQQMQEGKKKQEARKKAYDEFLESYKDKLPQETLKLAELVGPEKGMQLLTIGTKDREIRNDSAGRPRYVDTGELVYPEAPTQPSALRTITLGGKVVENIRDADLTPEKLREIQEQGAVVQPLGFSEKFESSKDVDFSPTKSKYLATQNIIIKTAELANKFAAEPTTALAAGTVTQFIDGFIQNVDAAGNILSGAKNKKVYKYIQDTSKSIEGTDYSKRIQEVSQATGVTESRVRDLAYLFAAARGQEGRGLSDKDYENALKIVSGGVGAQGRIAVLKDVSDSLRSEFYRDINFDIATHENDAYVRKLQNLEELPSFTDLYTPITGDPIDDLVNKYITP